MIERRIPELQQRPKGGGEPLSWYCPKVNGEFTASLVDLARTVERKIKEFAADINASVVDELATHGLAELLRNNVRSFKHRE